MSIEQQQEFERLVSHGPAKLVFAPKRPTAALENLMQEALTPPSSRADPDHWSLCADAVHAMAKKTWDPVLRADLLAIAANYELLAVLKRAEA